MLSIPRRLSAAGAAALLAAVAMPSPATAAPQEPFGFIAAQYEYRIGAVGGGGTVVTPSVDGRYLDNARLRVDLSGLAGVATAEFLDGCAVTGTTATCPLPGDDEFWHFIPVRLKETGAAGASGTIVWQLLADNLATQKETSKVTLADGPDLVFTGGSTPAAAKPGDSVSAPVSFVNNGTRTAPGVQLWFWHTHGIDMPRYSDCFYDESGSAICDIPVPLEPGDGIEIDGGLPATIAPYGFRNESIEMAVFPAGAASDRLKRERTRGTGRKLAVRTVKAGPGDDVHSDDNYGQSIWNVANHYDVTALGGSGKGAVGTEVKIKVGATNQGPAWLAEPRSGDFGALSVKVEVPVGSAAVAVPESCYSLATEDGQTVRKYGLPGFPVYFCQSTGSVLPNEGITADFTFRITQELAGATGFVTAFRPGGTNDEEQGTLEGDTNAANNRATLVLNPTSGGGGGGLPITGAKTGIAVGVGVALLVAGFVVYMAARRRRILLVTPE